MGHWESTEANGATPYVDVQVGADGAGLSVTVNELESATVPGTLRVPSRCFTSAATTTVGPVTPASVVDSPEYAGVDNLRQECATVGGSPAYVIRYPLSNERSGDTIALGGGAKLVFLLRKCTDGALRGGYLRYERRDLTTGAIVTDALLSRLPPLPR